MTNTEPAGVADERFAANLRDARDRLGISQAEVARQMAELGWAYHPQTVQRIEAGQRKVSAGEARALAQLVGASVDQLMMPSSAANAAGMLTTFIARTRHAYGQVANGTSLLLVSRRTLEAGVASNEAAGCHDSDRVRELVKTAREVLAETTLEQAIEAGRKEDARLGGH